MKDAKDDICFVEYNKKWAVMSNYLIQGKQNMSLQEARLLRLCITQIAKEDKELKTYNININELAKYLGITKYSLFRDVKKICKNLCQRVVEINYKDNWEIFHWVACTKYNDGIITIKISDELKPYVLELNTFFSKIRLDFILSLDSYYAIRLYELLQMQKGLTEKNKLTFSIENLRIFFDCVEKFERISSFKTRVIEKAVEEINLKTDININIDYIKTSKTITDIIFTIKDKKIEVSAPIESTKIIEEPELDLDDLIDQLQDIISESLRIKEYKALLAAANNDIGLIKEKYQIAKQQGGIDNLVGWLVVAIKEGYGTPTKTPKKNQFNNFPQREYTPKQIMELERALLKKQSRK